MNSRALFALVVSTGLSGCFLFGGNTPKDPLTDLKVEVSWYEGDTRNILADGETAVTMKSNRDFYLTLSDSKGLTKVETTAVANGASQTCLLLNDDNSVRSGDVDWPASNTDYTITAYSEASSKAFGPFSVTVQAPDTLINGSVNLSDQGTGDGNSGSLFVSRVFGWSGKGGKVGWEVYLVGQIGRLIDFATLKVGTTLKAVSPDKIQSTYHFARLDHGCGFLTTTFEAYTGTFDPSIVANKPTLADVRALPNPPSTATSIDLSNGLKFVYRTGDAKKGLIKVQTVTTSGATGMTANIYYSSEQ